MRETTRNPAPPIHLSPTLNLSPRTRASPTNPNPAAGIRDGCTRLRSWGGVRRCDAHQAQRGRQPLPDRHPQGTHSPRLIEFISDSGRYWRPYEYSGFPFVFSRKTFRWRSAAIQLDARLHFLPPTISSRPSPKIHLRFALALELFQHLNPDPLPLSAECHRN